MSHGSFTVLFAIAISVIFDVSGGFGNQLAQLFFSLPNSRTQELEADYIGLLMMAESCYDPQSAVDLWTRMKEAEQFEPPQFISTHPGHYNRRDQLKKYLPEAQTKYEDRGCNSVSLYASEFRDSFKGHQPPERGARQVQTRRPVPVSRTDDDDDFF